MHRAEPETVSRRAERLRLLLDLAHEDGAKALALGAGTHNDAEARESLALVNACLAVEYQLRERQWRALERLLSLVPPHGGELRDVLYLPGTTGLIGLSAAHSLGWLDVAPEETE